MHEFDLLVIGDINADLIIKGADIVPVFGQVEKYVDDAILELGGSSAIFAAGAGRLGLKVKFIGKVGNDEFGSYLINLLNNRGVDTSSIIIDPLIKTGLTLHLSRPDDRAMLTYPGTIPELKYEDIDQELLGVTRHVHIGSYFMQKGLHCGLPDLFIESHSNGATVSLDPGWDPDERWNDSLRALLSSVDIFFPNMKELLLISRQKDLSDSLEWCSTRGSITVVKRGREGAIVCQGKNIINCVGYEVDAVDNTGAGDSFNAGFLYGYIRGFNLKECLQWGCACGALSTIGIGGISSQPTVTEVEELFTESNKRDK